MSYHLQDEKECFMQIISLGKKVPSKSDSLCITPSGQELSTLKKGTQGQHG